MILVFEMVWTGTHHAPGNSVTIQTIARAARTGACWRMPKHGRPGGHKLLASGWLMGPVTG